MSDSYTGDKTSLVSFLELEAIALPYPSLSSVLQLYNQSQD